MIFIFEINIVNLNVEQKSPFDYKKTNRRYKSFTSLFGRHQFYYAQRVLSRYLAKCLDYHHIKIIVIKSQTY